MVDVNELPSRVRNFLTICVPFLRTPWMKKCVPLTSKSEYPRRGTRNFINVRVMKVRLFWAADQTLPIPDIRKTLQVLSCKVCCGDSWTRTNGLTALRLFGQVRNTRLASLPLAILVYSLRFRLASSSTAGASAPRPNRCERCALSPRYVCNENTRSCGLKPSKPIKFHKSRLAFSVEQIVINNESTKQFPAYHAGNIMVTFGLYG